MSQPTNDPLKETFRPDADPALERQADEALEGASLESLYGFDKPADEQPGGGPVAELDPERPGLRPGLVTRVDLVRGEIFVHMGGKDQGIVPLEQYDEAPPVGAQEMFVVERFDESEGIHVLARRGAISAAAWDTIQIGQVVEGLVNGMNKGGLEMQLGQLRAFLPAGQVDLVFHKDISVFIGQKLQVEVTQVDRRAKNVIVSRRRVLEREKEEAKKKLMAEIEVGQTRRGTVRSIADYGAFIDLGGADGLLHVSEMTHRRGVKPGDIVKVGDVVDVKIVRIDPDSGKLSLSLKATMPDPWVGADTKYAVGSEVTGRVTKVENFGAFIEIEEGIEGLLPISEMSWQRLRNAREIAKEGDTLRLVVIAMDPNAKKITFSLKQAAPDPWKDVPNTFPRGSVVEGKVLRTAEFGAFVEVERGVEGLVHISELSDQRVRQVSDVVKPGDTVQVRVLDVDADNRRLSLSIKRSKEPAAPEPSAATASATAAAQKKKRQRPLRGGLDF
jgi:small subunit ribosomal protein S1